VADAYREMPDVLGANEREEEAVSKLGRWRDRTRTTVLVIFALGGLVPGALGYWLVQEAQFATSGFALVRINAMGAAVVWGVTIAIGAFVARRVVRARMPGKVAELAKAYEIPEAELTEIASMVDKL